MKIRLLIITGIILLLSLPVQAEINYSYQAPLIPVPPQSTFINRQCLQSTANDQNVESEVIQYISARSAQEISAFYKRSLKYDGWKVLSETNKQDYAVISLNKAGVAANITARDTRDGGSDIYVSISQTLDEAAAAAQDPNWAPVYPGARRRMYSENKQTGQTTVVYATKQPVEQIVKFYSERMPNSGWWLKDKVKLAKIPGFGQGNYQNLAFEGWQGNCVVSVNRPQDLSKFGAANKDLTTILLTFTPER